MSKKGRREREEEGEKKGEIMLVSYYNLNNEVFAICSDLQCQMSPSQMVQDAKKKYIYRENGHVEVICVQPI